MPGKVLMNGLFKACKTRQWLRSKAELAYFFYS